MTLMRINVGAFTLLLVLAAAASTVPQAVQASGGPPTEDFQLFKNLPQAGNFEMQTVDGAPLSLDQLQGKVVLMNFWRSNCPYCEKEKQYLRKMLKTFNGSEVTVLSVNLWDPPAWVRRYAQANGRDFLTATRSGERKTAVDNVVRGRLLGYYVVNAANEAVFEVKGFPTTYVIDGEGRVVATHHGMARWDSPPVSRWVAELAHQSMTNGKAHVAGSDDRLPEWLDKLLGSGVEGVSHTRGLTGPRSVRAPVRE
jgi:thiol-disulfide isomerase/thioredoxin